ncbi:MAG: rod shape-determining protein MreD [Chloroflexota bacterium]|nr:rod shape-determining protein MreD [Chloroflexota bacterium]
MRTIVGIVLLALAAVAGSTFTPQVRVFGGQPDLVFLLVLSLAVVSPLEQSVTWALIGGILQDMLSLTPTGASAVGLVLTVFAVDWLRGQMFRLGVINLLVLTLLGTALQKFTIMMISAVVGFSVRPVEIAIYVVAPTMVYNLIFLFPVYWFARRLSRRRATAQRLTRPY